MTCPKPKYFLQLLFCLLFIHAGAQIFPYRNYTVREGLSSSIVFGMVQDTGLYLWFATDNGVSRFDGRNFRNFTTRDNLSHNSITGLYATPDGSVYASTYGKGIDVFRGRSFGSCNPGSGAPVFLNDFVIRNDTVFSFMGNNFYAFRPLSESGDAGKVDCITIQGSFLALLLTPDGSLLVSSNEGLFRYGDGSLINFNLQKGNG